MVLENQELQLQNEFAKKEAKLSSENLEKVQDSFHEVVASKNQLKQQLSLKEGLVTKLELEMAQLKSLQQQEIDQISKKRAQDLKLIEEQLQQQINKNKELEGDKVIGNKDKVSKIHGLVSELTQLQKSKNTLQERTEELEKKLSEVTDSNHALKILNQKLERENESLKDDLKLSELKLKKEAADKAQIQVLYEQNLAKRGGLSPSEKNQFDVKTSKVRIDTETDVGDFHRRENEILKNQNKKLSKLNQALNQKLVDIVARRVIEKAEEKNRCYSSDQLTNPAGPCSVDYHAHEHQICQEHQCPHSDYRSDCCLNVHEQYNSPYIHQYPIFHEQNHSVGHQEPYLHTTFEEDYRSKNPDSHVHQERVTFAKTAPTGFRREFSQVQDSHSEYMPVVERLEPVRRDFTQSYSQQNENSQGFKTNHVQLEAERLLRLNQEAIMSTQEFKRSGAYLQAGLEGVGLYEDPEKVSETQLQQKIDQLLAGAKF